ncbi:replication initiation and membrane attachment protein [Sporosarcina luteola]|nr:replication initiation and membrane attachment protein [Sporosarcina luteola]
MLYKELQPVDTYKIKLSHPFSDYDRQLLTLFYQPLIGPEAMSLFLTLWADAERDKDSEYNHYHLMNVLTMPLGKVFESRLSLEGIGLLRTYCKKMEEDRHFIYELLTPLDAKSFFADPLLSTFLFSKVGEQAYRGLLLRFASDIAVEDSYEEVSRTFLDVYKPIRYGIPDHLLAESELESRTKPTGIPFSNEDFDFGLLRAGLSEQMVPSSSLSGVSRELITKLAFLYSFTPLDMQKVIMMALDDNLKIPEERLRKAAVDYYKMNRSKQVPVLEKAFQQTAVEDEKPVKNMTQEEKFIHDMETTSPVEVLRGYTGSEPLSVDVQLAEKLVNTYGFPVGVVNVLLNYVIIRNDGKITNNFVERIASTWRNKKVKTAKEAMELARAESDQYRKWLKDGQKNTSKRNPIREEKVPEWFKEKAEPASQLEQPSPEDPAIEEKRRELLAKLEAMKSEVK